MRPFLSSFVLVAVALVGACSSTSHTRFPLQKYVPVSRSMEALGELHLSNTLMRFDELKGDMKLEYAGQMPESAGEDLAGASVYRVKNWSAYHKANVGHQGYCEVAPRFVTVNSDSGAAAWSREINVGLLTLEDWKKFSLDEHRSCAGGKYVRTRE